MAIYAFSLTKGGANEREVVETVINLPKDSWVSVAGMVIGCLFSMLGGYVCARIAKGAALKAGHIMAVLSVASGLLFGVEGYSLPMHVVLASATWASVMGGVYLGRIRNRPTPTPALADAASREPD